MATSLRIVGAPTTYQVSELNGTTSQHIAVPATTIGNLLVIMVSCSQFYGSANTVVTSCADSGSNAYTQRGTTQKSGTGSGHCSTQIFTAPCNSSAQWITVTITASNDAAMCAVTFLEIQGAAASPIDATNGGTATSASSVVATNTPTATGDMVLYFAAVGAMTSVAHSADDKLNLAYNAAPYPSGTSGASLVTDSCAVIGNSAAVQLTTVFNATASSNWAWSTLSLKAATPGTGGLYLVTNGQSIASADLNQIVNVLNGATTNVPVNVANRIQASFTGATSQSGLVGGVNGAPPTTGSFLAGDMVIDQFGCAFICTSGGSPGTWTRVGNANYIARAHQTTVQNYTGSSSLQTVTTDTMDFDPRSMWNSGENGFTIPFSGARWRVIAGQHVNVGGGSGRFYVSIQQKRSGTTTEVSRGYDGPTVSGNAGGIVSDILSFNSGDIVKAAFVSTATGSTVAGTAANYLCLALADG